MKNTLILCVVISLGMVCAFLPGFSQESPRMNSATCLGDNIFLRESNLDNAIWWDPTTGNPCPIEVEEAVRLAISHAKKPSSHSVHPIVLLHPCARIVDAENNEVVTGRKSRYLYWIVRLVHDQGFEGGKTRMDMREYIVMFNKSVFRVLQDGSLFRVRAN